MIVVKLKKKKLSTQVRHYISVLMACAIGLCTSIIASAECLDAGSKLVLFEVVLLLAIMMVWWLSCGDDEDGDKV